MAQPQPPPTPALGFVELDEYAKDVVGRAAAARASAYGVVIPLFSNRGFLPFLRNLLCSMRRLDVENYVVMAMDNGTCPELLTTPGLAGSSLNSACVYPYARSAGAVTSEQGVAKYRSVAFNRMVMQRPLWMRWLLQQGYSVIQCDLDIVWLNDPQPHLLARTVALQAARASRRGGGASSTSTGSTSTSGSVAPAPAETPARVAPHLLFQSEQAYGLNGGFYFARPSNVTLAFFDAWIERLTVMITLPSFEEQHALNSALGRLRKGGGGGGASGSAASSLLQHGGHGGEQLRYAPLDEELFPNGKIWWSYPWLADKKKAFLVHTNWNKQQKKSRMARDRLWLLDDADTKCDRSFDPSLGVSDVPCSKLCAPIAYAAPGGKNPTMKRCRDLNREDDYRARKLGSTLAKRNHSAWAAVVAAQSFHGMFWHPLAYAALPGCVRNLSIVAPYAAMADAQLRANKWGRPPPAAPASKR